MNLFWLGFAITAVALALGFVFGQVAAEDDGLDKESYRQGFAAGWCTQEHPEDSPPDPGQAWVDCVDGVVAASRTLEGDA